MSIKNYYKKNKGRLKAYQREWTKKNPEKNAKSTREYNARSRKALVDLLGGKCVRCGFNDPRALQVDHVNGGGTKDIKEMTGMKNIEITRRVLSGSKEYQLLCANCNWIKRVENNETRRLKKDNV